MAEYLESIQVEVTGNIARVAGRPTYITSGSVGLPVEFAFDSRWDGLDKVAVFKAGGVSRSMELPDVKTTVPWEVLEKSGLWLSIGVYGMNADGSVAIPTVWVKVAIISPGVDPSADPSLPPTLPVWKELQNAVGDLEEDVETLEANVETLEEDVKQNSKKISEVDTKADKVYVDNRTLKCSSPHNWLDNSDFRNPVNQRGQKSYIGSKKSSDKNYTIDRWLDYEGNFDIYVEDGYLRIVNNASKSACYEQRVPYGTLDPDKTYTFARKGTDGGMTVAKAGIDHYPAKGFSVIRQYFRPGEWQIIWCALYEGEYTKENIPEYKPKGYAAELLECQRYFWKTDESKGISCSHIFGIATSSQHMQLHNCVFPMEMRDAPSLESVTIYDDTKKATSNFTVSSSKASKQGVAEIGSFSAELVNGRTYSVALTAIADL